MAALTLVAVALPAAADQSDPLAPLISQAESFIRRGESGGVTLDPRHFFSLPEHLRLTVVPQLAASCDLFRGAPTDARYLDITERANYLTSMGAAARSFDAADGMLAYALLRAFEITANTAYRDAAQPIIDGFLLAPVSGDANRVLMAGLGLAQHIRLTSDPVALTRLSEISLLTARLQHADGSFDHVCSGARDVHYTAWTAMEMDLILRLVDDPVLRGALDRAQAFLQGRIGADGAVAYQDTLSSGATIYYFSKPACPSDYDTRGWVNELAYHALLFDRARDFRYNLMMIRLASLQAQGAWPDKWDFLPSFTDPSYVWASSPRSVVRTSLVLWTLASIQARRASRGQVIYTAPTPAGRSPDPTAAESSGIPALSLAPNPARGDAWVALRLARPGTARLSILDASGRRLRDLLSQELPAGSRRIRWDGRDQRGAMTPPGLYFVRLECEGRTRTARLVRIASSR